MRTWREAWEGALYGVGGFFTTQRPRDHFRTSVTASSLLAEAVRELAGRVDRALGLPDPFDVVDLGAGRGELLLALPDVPPRWRLTAVERAPDPGVGLRWLPEVPRLTGLLVANEWLDDVPCDLVLDGRVVLEDGSAGPPASPRSAEWAATWWPGGGLVEDGSARDDAWAAAVARVDRGVAVAVDYGHLLGERRPTLTGYRDGRQVEPVLDGSCDVTCHVAVDSCAAATGATLVRQSEALAALGVSAAAPAWDGDAASYALALQRAGRARELLDPAGLGGFWWLVQEVGVPRVVAWR